MNKDKNISGYGAGSVDVVMSVDQVAKEAASIIKNESEESITLLII